ncbi:MAG: hypothetical protein XU12_C0001G0230 [Deltaproteobacteria bacterium CSP1-8]|nr:MAG: hypothetical protein XU12_C0001G0230 [Deltaproteobacteria bacterium CSP1-8]
MDAPGLESAAAVAEGSRAEIRVDGAAHAFFASLLKNTAARGGTTTVRACRRP